VLPFVIVEAFEAAVPFVIVEAFVAAVVV